MDEREETPPAVKIARQLHSQGWRIHRTRGACVLRHDLPGGGPYTTFRVEPAVYEAMCELEKPPAPTAEQLQQRIQELEEQVSAGAPKPEPVRWLVRYSDGHEVAWITRAEAERMARKYEGAYVVPLYEHPPAPTAEQTLSEPARIQMLEELLENSDAAFAWQRDRAEDAESQVERLQERIRDLENERMREESREAELAVALDQERKCRDRIQELEQKLRDSFPREYVEKWQEERRRVEALCVERYDRIQELEEHFERQRGEPVGWVFMPSGSNEPTALYWKRMQPAMVLARATWEAKGLARHTLYAGQPEPAEQPADDPATAEARKWLADGWVPDDTPWHPAMHQWWLKKERPQSHKLVMQAVYDAAVRLLAERDTDPELPSLPDARAGYDAGDEDDGHAGIEVVEAPETPLDDKPMCLRTCGTKHRGCDPQCPKRWYETGRDEDDYDGKVL